MKVTGNIDEQNTELKGKCAPGFLLPKVFIFSETHQKRASLVAQSVKNLPAVQETRVQSLGWEDSPGGGHGNPLQYSCLENPMDRGAWRATVHRVTQSWTQLK